MGYPNEPTTYKSKSPKVTDPEFLPVAAMPERMITKATCEYFGVKQSFDTETGKASEYHFPLFDRSGGLVGYQHRKLLGKTKDGTWSDKGTESAMPFGSHKTSGSGKMLIVTEGTEDALAVHQMLADIGKAWRVVSALGTDRWRTCLDFFKGFEKVVILFDNDDMGREGAEALAWALGGAAYIAKIEKFKDPCEMLLAGLGGQEIVKIIGSAKKYEPAGFVSADDIWEAMNNYTEPVSYPYPPDWSVMASSLVKGMRAGEVSIWTGSSGQGKCFSPDQDILMHDLSLKKAKDICVGDKVMGPDGLPRNVLCLHSGVAEMYKVTPTKGQPYTVSAEHDLWVTTNLSIQKMGWVRGIPFKITAKEFSELPNHYVEHALSGLRAGLEKYGSGEDDNAYMLGLWLADGDTASSRITIGDKDKEIIDEVKSFAARNGYGFTITKGRGCRGYNMPGGWLAVLQSYQAIGNKHIPEKFFHLSRHTRLELLAGLLDGDGSVNAGCYEITVKSDQLCNDITNLARYLGFVVTHRKKFSKCRNFEGRYYNRLYISGNVGDIPVRLPRKKITRRPNKAPDRVGLRVTPVGPGQFFGFELDGDKLHCLPDLQVTHNTTVLRRIKQHLVSLGIKIGEIELEESKEKTVRGMWEFHMRKPLTEFTAEERRRAWEETYGTGNLILFDHGSAFMRKCSGLESYIEHMIYAKGCKVVFLDHITLSVNHFGDGSGGLQQQDEMMAKFMEIANRTGAHLALISHIRKGFDDQGVPYSKGGVIELEALKGSGSLGQIAADVFAIERNGHSTNPTLKDTSLIRVLKCRETGFKGPADALRYDRDTRTLFAMPGSTYEDLRAEELEREREAKKNKWAR
jgi:hypothetical protein